MVPDLTERAVDARERMDAPDADADMLDHTYRRFALVNALVSRWGAVYRRDIRPRARRGKLRILDIGAGGGDLSRALAAWSRRDGVAAEITALDADPRAVAWSRAHDDGRGVHHRCAHSAELVAEGARYDVVLSNHLLHHLDATEMPALLSDSRLLVRDSGLVVHRDIARSRLAYSLFAAATLPFSRNLLAGSFIREDGLTSIRRSYTASELTAVAPAGWTIRRDLPAHLSLRWEQGDA